MIIAIYLYNLQSIYSLFLYPKFLLLSQFKVLSNFLSEQNPFFFISCIINIRYTYRNIGIFLSQPLTEKSVYILMFTLIWSILTFF